MVVAINTKRQAGKDDTPATSVKNPHSSALGKGNNARNMLKQENDELFAWNAALQHQILVSCVSAAVSKESVGSTKSVHEIKEDCLKRVTRNVKHAMKEPATKKGA